MAEPQTGDEHRSLADDLISGRFVPWICAFSAIGLLSVRIGPVNTVIVAVSACALLLLVLVGYSYWTMWDEKSVEALGPIAGPFERVAWNLEGSRRSDALTSAG